jgi:choline kinase
MEAILYVAGRSMRLGAALTAGHKVLIEFGGKSLLERHVMHLAQLGIRKLTVITGFAADKVRAHFGNLNARYKVQIKEIHNPDFTEGSVFSMNVSIPALEKMRESILLMDGDVLYDIRMLERLVHSNSRTALLVDRNYSTADDDPVLVPMRGGKPFDFVKKWNGEAETIGESIGFFKIAPEDLPALIEETRTRSARSRNDSYDDVLRVLVQRGIFGAEDVTGLPWTEIDFPQDLEYAEKTILPRLI